MKEKVVIVVTRSKKPDITGFIQVRYPNPGKTAVHLHLLPFSTIKTQENSQQKSTKETALLMWHTKMEQLDLTQMEIKYLPLLKQNDSSDRRRICV